MNTINVTYGKEVKRPDGGTCLCLGALEEGMNYFIVTQDQASVWCNYDPEKHGSTWSKLIRNLYKMHGWKVEQIEPY